MPPNRSTIHARIAREEAVGVVGRGIRRRIGRRKRLRIVVEIVARIGVVAAQIDADVVAQMHAHIAGGAEIAVAVGFRIAVARVGGGDAVGVEVIRRRAIFDIARRCRWPRR